MALRLAQPGQLPLQETELLRAVVEEVRDDDRPGEADDELRAIRGALEQLPAGGAR